MDTTSRAAAQRWTSRSDSCRRPWRASSSILWVCSRSSQDSGPRTTRVADGRERGVELHLDPVDLVHDDDVAAQAREFQVAQPLLVKVLGHGALQQARGVGYPDERLD